MVLRMCRAAADTAQGHCAAFRPHSSCCRGTDTATTGAPAPSTQRRTRVDYTNFGTAGLQVSRLALGLGLRGQADLRAAQRLVEHAIDQGSPSSIAPTSTAPWTTARTLAN